MMDLEKLFSHTSLQCQWRLKMIFRLMTMMGTVGLLNALATFQWHISYIIYRLYTTYVQYRRHVWYCETCWHHPSVHVWNHQCSSCIEKTLIQTIPLPENNQAIDCHEKKKLPCMPVLLSSARQLTVLQGASYSAVLQGASYRAVL